MQQTRPDAKRGALFSVVRTTWSHADIVGSAALRMVKSAAVEGSVISHGGAVYKAGSLGFLDLGEHKVLDKIDGTAALQGNVIV